MRLEIDIDTNAMALGLAKVVETSLAKQAQEAVQWGSIGRSIKESADKAVVAIAQCVLNSPGFTEKAAAALLAGMLRGFEARGEKIGKGMATQQALDLVAMSRAAEAKARGETP